MIVRDLAQLIKRIVSCIPEDEEMFRSALEDVATSVRLTAPEVMTIRWEQVSELLEDWIPEDPQTWAGWEEDIVHLWNPDYKPDDEE